MQGSDIKAGPELYVRVRQGFIGKDSSLNRWCLENGIKRQTAVACLKGMWNGPKGFALRKRIVLAAGIVDTPISSTKVG